ncbi:MAG: hypothetical protein AAF959_19700 [Cyanobacteria bacterium P01_D01_bin.56]
MDRASLLKFARYGFYGAVGVGLLYVLIPMDLPTLQSSILEISLQQLTVLIIVALFVERSLEVYKLFYFSPEKERLITQVAQARLEWQSFLGDVTEDERAQAAKLRLLNEEERLRVYKNHTRQNLYEQQLCLVCYLGWRGCDR